MANEGGISERMDTSMSTVVGAPPTKKEADEIAMRQKRYRVNESNLLIMSTKNKIISILQRVLDIQNDMRLTQFLTEFHNYEEEAPLTPEVLRFIGQVNKSRNLEDLFKKDPELGDMKPILDARVVSWMNKAYGDKKLDLDRIS